MVCYLDLWSLLVFITLMSWRLVSLIHLRFLYRRLDCHRQFSLVKQKLEVLQLEAFEEVATIRLASFGEELLGPHRHWLS